MVKSKGLIIWLTGLSGAGKSTLSTELKRKLVEKDQSIYVLDGDIIRKGLNSDLGYSSKDRSENIRRIGEVTKLFSDASINTIVAFISPFNKDRARVRKSVKPGLFIEVFLNCPLEICEARDTKGLYKKARNHEIKNFTGISSPYEPPLSPEITIRTDLDTVEQSAQKVLVYLDQNGLLP